MGKKLFFYFLMVVFMLAILEVFAFVAVQLLDPEDFFDHRESVLPRLTAEDLAGYVRRTADPALGWRNIGPRTRREDNCLGQEIEYNYDAVGARIYDEFDPVTARIMVVGDSYTNGQEIDDQSTYPARLADLLGTSVVNHGVGGYGPTQSVLSFAENIAAYPQAEVVVLGIMYENLYRMVNSYRPVLYDSSTIYALKPYMASGDLIPHPGAGVLSSLDRFLPVANKAFDTDFWAKPRLEFPYLVSLSKSLGSDYFAYRKLRKLFRDLGMPEYFLIFSDHDIQRNLISLLNRYALLAREAGVKPVAVFIPRNRHDTSSAAQFIEQHRQQIDTNLVLGDVGEKPGVDWLEFSLKEIEGDNPCHPSAYGYQVIADYIAELLRLNKLWSDSGDNPG